MGRVLDRVGQMIARYLEKPVSGYEPFTPWLCFYFSAAIYSSLGFGDIVPMGELRLIAVMEGLNGLMLIAWTAAYSFLAMEEFWEKPQRRKT